MRLRNVAILGAGIFVFGGILAGAGYLTGGAKKSIVWDNGFKTEAIQHEEQELTQAEHLVIDFKNSSIAIRRGKEFNLISDYMEGDKPVVTNVDGKITITSVADIAKVSLGFSEAREKYVLTVPETMRFKTLNIKNTHSYMDVKDLTVTDKTTFFTSNGGLEIKNATLNNMTITQSNSDIELSKVIATQLWVNQSNGNTEIKNSKFSGAANIQNQNGDNELTANEFAGKATVENHNGNTEIQHNTFAGPSLFTNTNGNIELDDSVLNGLSTIKNNNGAIALNSVKVDGITAAIKNGNIEAFGANSDTSYNKNESAANLVKIENTNGDINVK